MTGGGMRRIESSFQFLFSPLSIGTFCYSMHDIMLWLLFMARRNFSFDYMIKLSASSSSMTLPSVCPESGITITFQQGKYAVLNREIVRQGKPRTFALVGQDKSPF